MKISALVTPIASRTLHFCMHLYLQFKADFVGEPNARVCGWLTVCAHASFRQQNTLMFTCVLMIDRGEASYNQCSPVLLACLCDVQVCLKKKKKKISSPTTVQIIYSHCYMDAMIFQTVCSDFWHPVDCFKNMFQVHRLFFKWMI